MPWIKQEALSGNYNHFCVGRYVYFNKNTAHRLFAGGNSVLPLRYRLSGSVCHLPAAAALWRFAAGGLFCCGGAYRHLLYYLLENIALLIRWLPMSVCCSVRLRFLRHWQVLRLRAVRNARTGVLFLVLFLPCRHLPHKHCRKRYAV